MDTVGGVIRTLLPHGTEYQWRGRDLVPRPSRSWKSVPVWPPDLFAVAASLVQHSGCYALLSASSTRKNVMGHDYVTRVQRQAKPWREGGRQRGWSGSIQRLWDQLRKQDDARIVGVQEQRADWWPLALELMATADEASKGFGFISLAPKPLQAYEILHRRSWAPLVYSRHSQRRKDTLANNTASTLCVLVPEAVACVQPKSRTAQVGCTLRSLSHHLALLPGTGEVRTRWLLQPGSKMGLQPLNVLVIPYPYKLDGNAFSQGKTRKSWGYFRLTPQWLDDATPDKIVAFLTDLLNVARGEVSDVHGIVLPELALDEERATGVAQRMGALDGLEFFVTGMLRVKDGLARNEAFTSLYNESADPVVWWEQSKHHRWKLDRGQITRYHLGHALGPHRDWWEDIELGPRQVHFYHFREGASMAVLICEDLARVEPVQPAIRAVGPNLVIALLLDGPQLEGRWPGRYATVLADDPGSAVLSLTSLGMVSRSAGPTDNASRAIALWKDSLGSIKSLNLPSGAHALLLTVSGEWVEERTLDGRWDGCSTLQLSLTGVRPVTATGTHAWVRI